jgi:hypothetical protein
VPWPQSVRGWTFRIGLPAFVAGVGVAGSVGLDAYWQSRVSNGSVSYVGDLLFAAVPFFVLAALMFMSGCFYAPLAGAMALLALTYFENRANATSDSSTAGLVFLWSWLGGLPLAGAVVGVEAEFRERRARARSRPQQH